VDVKSTTRTGESSKVGESRSVKRNHEERDSTRGIGVSGDHKLRLLICVK
jgi:hypothetical protein